MEISKQKKKANSLQETNNELETKIKNLSEQIEHSKATEKNKKEELQEVIEEKVKLEEKVNSLLDVLYGCPECGLNACECDAEENFPLTSPSECSVEPPLPLIDSESPLNTSPPTSTSPPPWTPPPTPPCTKCGGENYGPCPTSVCFGCTPPYTPAPYTGSTSPPSRTPPGTPPPPLRGTLHRFEQQQ